jgi:amino acid transporter
MPQIAKAPPTRIATAPPRRPEAFQLAKVAGAFAVMASALTHEYGAGITFVAPQSVGVYPGVKGLVPLAMVVTGIALLPKTFLFMRFSRHMPTAGSAYAWMSRTLSLPVAFVVTFLFWVGLAGAIGVVAFTFGTFLGQAFVSAGWPGGDWMLGNAGHLVLGLAAIWLMFAAQARSVSSFVVTVRILFVVVVLTTVVVIGYGFLTPSSEFVAGAAAKTGVRLAAPTSSSGASLGDFFSVCAVLVFAYGGLLAGPTLGGEARDAARTVPRGTFLGWLTAFVLYSLVTFAIFAVAPWWAVVGLVDHGQDSLTTMPGVMSVVAPGGVGTAINLAVAAIVAKTLAPQIMSCSRTLFALGQDHLLPAAFRQTSARKSPLVPLVVTAVIGSLFLVQTVFAGFTVGVVIRSISLLVLAAAISLGVLNIRFGQRARFAGRAWAADIGRGTGIVVAAVLSIVVSVVFIKSVLIVSGDGLGLQPWFESLVAVAIGSALFAWMRRRSRAQGIDPASMAATPPTE